MAVGRLTRIARAALDAAKAPSPHAAATANRKTAPNAPAPIVRPPDLHFAAVVEIDRFPILKRHVGFALAKQAVEVLADLIRRDLQAERIERAGRAALEFVFAAKSEAEARARLIAMGLDFSRAAPVAALGFEVTIRIGVVRAHGTALDDAAIEGAEQALAQAQQRGQRIVFGTGAAPAGATSLELLTELGAALRNGELEPFYQPKLRTRTREITSAEALVRWRHPSRGLVRPDEFIGLAEESGQIRALTEHVIERALLDQQLLRSRGLEIAIDINLSGVLISDLDFAAWALSRLVGRGGNVGFEITETAMIADPEGALANLRRFADAGIRLAIDDYGSGFSSLAYLQKLPVHELKIDKSFISGIANTQRDPLLVRSTIELAHALDMEVVAEGVDTPEALALLQVMGCDCLQGYLISPPLPFAEFETFLQDGSFRDLSATLPSLSRLRRPLATRGAG